MSPLKLLRFKIATSFAIAILGAILFVRLAIAMPLSPNIGIPLSVALVFSVAGAWRGQIYLKALKGLRGS